MLTAATNCQSAGNEDLGTVSSRNAATSCGWTRTSSSRLEDSLDDTLIPLVDPEETPKPSLEF